MLKKCYRFLLCFTMIFILLFQSTNINAKETEKIMVSNTTIENNEPESRLPNAIILSIEPVSKTKFKIVLQNEGFIFDRLDYASATILIVPNSGAPYEKTYEFISVSPAIHQSFTHTTMGSGWASVYIVSLYGRDGDDLSLVTTFPSRTTYNPYN